MKTCTHVNVYTHVYTFMSAPGPPSNRYARPQSAFDVFELNNQDLTLTSKAIDILAMSRKLSTQSPQLSNLAEPEGP